MRLPGPIGDAVADAIRAAAARGVAVRIAFNQDGDRAVKPLPPPPRTEPSLLEQLGVPLRGDPRRPGPHAPQVRGPRRRRGVDRLDELDARLVDARGERAHHGRLGGVAAAYARDFEDLWGARARRGQRRASTRPAGRRRRRPRARVVLAPGAARSSRTASPSASAARRAARADRLAGADRGADPRGAQPGAGRAARRRRRACRTPPRSRRSSRSGGATRTRRGRGRCSRACSRGCRGRARSRRRTRRARSTTTCTPRSRSPTTSSSSAPSTSRARARRTPRTCSRSPTPALAERMAAFVDDVRGALPGDRGRRPRRELNPLALRAGAHERDDLVGVVGDVKRSRSSGAIIPSASQPLAQPVDQPAPRTLEPTSTTGKWRILRVWMSSERLEELVERPEAAGEDDERARVAHEHDLAREEVVEAQRDVLVARSGPARTAGRC